MSAYSAVIAMVGKPGEMLPQVFQLRDGCLPFKLSDPGCDRAEIIPREGLGSIIFTRGVNPCSPSGHIDVFLRRYAKSNSILYLFSDSDDANDLWMDENHEWARPLFHPVARAELYRRELTMYTDRLHIPTATPNDGDDDDGADYY